MRFLAKTWSGFVSTLKLMTLPFKGDKQLRKQLHVTIKQINAEPSVIPPCHGDVLQPQQSSMQTLSQKSSGRKWIYQKWVEGEECKELSCLAVKLGTKVCGLAQINLRNKTRICIYMDD